MLAILLACSLTVRALVHVLLDLTLSCVVITCTECAYLYSFAATRVLLEMVKALAPVTPLNKKAIENRAGARSNKNTVAIVPDSCPDSLGHPEDSLVFTHFILHWCDKYDLGIFRVKQYTIVFILITHSF